MKRKFEKTAIQSFLSWSLSLSMLLTPVAFGNVVGSDAQNFNATTNGLDFVTVHSSETLEPGFFNLGLFFNHAVNSLPYFNEDNDTQSRVEFNDTVTTMDFHAGVGIMNGWDLGVTLPNILSQKVDSDDLHGQFGNTGLTEIRLNTKLRLLGDDSGGVALIGSVNLNRMENNPYTGSDPGPTYNLEAAFDTTVRKIALGFNLGYRWRTPGEPIEEFPIEPTQNQLIASAAASYLMPSIDTKLIFELFGSRPANSGTKNSDRQASSAETLVTIKHDLTHNISLHGGAGTELTNGQASADWRGILGVNWTSGPAFNKPEQPIKVARNQEAPKRFTRNKGDPFANAPQRGEERIIIHDILFEFDSDHLVLAGAQDTLTRLAAYLRKPPTYKKLVIEGHTCSIGAASYNASLSQRRANTIKKWLVTKFKLNPNTIVAKGYGESKPLADNGNHQGRQLNRRVEFRIFR